MKDMKDEDVTKIKSIQFGISSSKDNNAKSVVDVSSVNFFDNSGNFTQNGLFDTRMSTSGKSPVDGLKSNMSPGYFGRIQLNIPVFNVIHLETIKQLLSNICICCAARLHKTFDELDVEELSKMPKSNYPYPSKQILKNTMNPLSSLDKLKKIKSCPYCNKAQPNKYEIIKANTKEYINIKAYYGKRSDAIAIFPEFCQKLFQKIHPDDLMIFGFNAKYAHPESLILNTIPVCPPCIRPSNIFSNGITTEDHTSIRYKEVIEYNKKIVYNIDDKKKREIYRKFLTHEVTCLFNNDPKHGFIPLPDNATVPHQTFAQRITGMEKKNGRIHGNLMSRRVRFSGRTVIIPDASIELDQVGFPKMFASKMTFPEKVTMKNISRLQQYVYNGDVYPGSIGVEKYSSNKEQLENILEKNATLNIGDIVHRHLVNGDYIILNRQPSLHKKSMMGHRIVVRNELSLRLNPNVTEPYNADFDGDEMNVHVPQSVVTVSEVKSLCGIEKQIVDASSNETAFVFIQDNVLSAFNMMKNRTPPFEKHELMNVLCRSHYYFDGSIDSDKNYNGSEIIRFFIPYSESLENIIFTKKSLKTIIYHTYQEYGNKFCFELAGNLQKLFTAYMTKHNFSVGPKDVLKDEVCKQFKHAQIIKMKSELEKLNTKAHSLTRYGNMKTSEYEKLLLEITSKATNLIEENIKEKETSRFKSMIESGSKGNMKNIMQIKGLIGQQIVNGGRIKNGFSHYRTLPHFKKFDEDIRSNGFIQTPFSSGLNQYEYFLHASGGREGLIEQALNTADSGYLQAQMIKFVEDLKISSTSTVCDGQGNVLQFEYGDDGLDGKNIIAVDISNILNMNTLTFSETYDLDYTGNVSRDVFWGKFVTTKSCYYERLPINGWGSYTKIFSTFLFELQIIRYDVSRKLTKGVNSSKVLKFTVDISKKVQNTVSKFKLNKDNTTELMPHDIINAYKSMFERLENKYTENTQIFKFLLYIFASPKQLICEFRFNIESFNYFLEDLEMSYRQTRIEYGEPVGLLAAQSIGEPSTQLTLNSFHSAGSGVAQGIPRLKELLYAQKYKEPISTSKIHLKKPYCFVRSKVDTFKKTIQNFTLKDICREYELFYSNLEEYTQRERTTNAINYNTNAQWILKLQLSNGLSVNFKEELRKKMESLDNIHNPIVFDNSICFRIDINNAISSNKQTKNFIVEKHLEKFIENSVLNLQFGIKNITHSAISEIRQEFVSAYSEIMVDKKFVLETNGSNLNNVLQNKNVDTEFTYSNNIHEVYEHFGIEAVRELLLNEIYNVLEDVKKIDIRHISIIVDRMLFIGNINSIEVKTMQKYFDVGPLALGSHESVIKNIQHASITGEIDHLNGISSNYMVAQVPAIGAGSVILNLDEGKFETNKRQKLTKNLPSIIPKKERDEYFNFSV